MLAETKRGMSGGSLPFPAESLAIRDLFPGHIAKFPLADLPKGAHDELKTMFLWPIRS